MGTEFAPNKSLLSKTVYCPKIFGGEKQFIAEKKEHITVLLQE